MEIRPGAHVGERFAPIDSAACYSPRGKGSFPSVTLMSVIPAVVAGVPEIIVLTPPGPDGNIDPATLVAADIAGTRKVFKAGGAQAVAAAAYGTQTIPRLRQDRRPWQPVARRCQAGAFQPHRSRHAGRAVGSHRLRRRTQPTPKSPRLIQLSNPNMAMIHRCFLSPPHAPSPTKTRAAIPEFWKEMSSERAGYSAAVLGSTSGGIVLCDGAERAYAFINDYAPEHLQILGTSPRTHLPHIRNAAEILLGEDTPGSVANYMMGPNCVLPTSAAAKTRSPLGVMNFMKSCSVGELTREGLQEMGPKTEVFAQYEGLRRACQCGGGDRE